MRIFEEVSRMANPVLLSLEIASFGATYLI
jgi:hypothetical protein